MLSIIPTLTVLSFLFNSRFLQTGNLQTGPNQFVENQKQNQDNTGRFGMKNLPKRFEFFCRNVFAETSLPKRPVPHRTSSPVGSHFRKMSGPVSGRTFNGIRPDKYLGK